MARKLLTWRKINCPGSWKRAFTKEGCYRERSTVNGKKLVLISIRQIKKWNEFPNQAQKRMNDPIDCYISVRSKESLDQRAAFIIDYLYSYSYLLIFNQPIHTNITVFTFWKNMSFKVQHLTYLNRIFFTLTTPWSKNIEKSSPHQALFSTPPVTPSKPIQLLNAVSA